MTEYKIVPDGPNGYGVEVISPERFLSVRGFSSQRDALAWIEAQKASEAVAEESAKWDRRAGS